MAKPKKNYVGNAALKKIIEVWGEFHSQLRGVHKNKHIYAEMCMQLADEHGVSLTPNELRNRINNLAKKYRKERRAVSLNGGDPSGWEYYESIHKIIDIQSNFTNEPEDESSDDDSVQLHNSMETLPNEDVKEKLPSKSDIYDSIYSDPLDNAIETVLNKDLKEEVPSSSSSYAKKRKRNSDEDFLELAKKEQEMMEYYLTKSIENEEKALGLMEQTNAILLAMLNKNM